MLESGLTLSKHSLPSVQSFLEKVKDGPGLFPKNVYSVFTFDPIYNLHLAC